MKCFTISKMLVNVLWTVRGTKERAESTKRVGARTVLLLLLDLVLRLGLVPAFLRVCEPCATQIPRRAYPEDGEDGLVVLVKELNDLMWRLLCRLCAGLSLPKPA